MASRPITPLFRNPATNQPLSYQEVHLTIKELMLAIGEEPSQFGTHSLRIGGATALFRVRGRRERDDHSHDGALELGPPPLIRACVL